MFAHDYWFACHSRWHMNKPADEMVVHVADGSLYISRIRATNAYDLTIHLPELQETSHNFHNSSSRSFP